MRLLRIALGAPAIAACLGLACTTTKTDIEPPPPDAGDHDATFDVGSPEKDSGVADATRPDPRTARRLETQCASDPCYVAVSGSGSLHMCGLLRDGTVRCWGSDDHGALGRGRAATPVEGATAAAVTGLTGVTQISVGKNSGTCARTSDGAVYCWGRNDTAQLGRPSSESSLPTPTRVEGIPAASSVALGSNSACAITSEDGALHCWGAMARTEDDAPPRPPQRMVDFRPPVRSVSIGFARLDWPTGDTIVAQLDDGVLATLGKYPAGASSVPAGSSSIPVELTGVVRGFEFAYVTSDGLLRQWLPDKRALYIPQPWSVVDATIATQLDNWGVTGLEQGAVLLASGRLFRWGVNTSGTLGFPVDQLDYAEEPRDMTDVVGNRIVSFATTRSSTCVSLVDGKIECWGGNEHGELGRGTLDGAAHPTAEEIR